MKEKTIITVNPIAALIEQLNEAKKGSYIVVTNYKGEDGKVQTIYGNVGMDYGDLKEQAIADLKAAILDKDFDDVEVSGNCNYDPVKGVFNARKRKDCELLKEYNKTYPASEVEAVAKSILFDWENPKERKSNELSLGADGKVMYNEETENFKVEIAVAKTVYKEELSEPDDKPKNQAPDTKLKEVVRDRFMKKIKRLTIGKDNYDKISLNKVEIH